MAKQTDRKPRGWGAFADLVKKLVKVPKEEIDRESAGDKPKRRKNK